MFYGLKIIRDFNPVISTANAKHLATLFNARELATISRYGQLKKFVTGPKLLAAGNRLPEWQQNLLRSIVNDDFALTETSKQIINQNGKSEAEVRRFLLLAGLYWEFYDLVGPTFAPASKLEPLADIAEGKLLYYGGYGQTRLFMEFCSVLRQGGYENKDNWVLKKAGYNKLIKKLRLVPSSHAALLVTIFHDYLARNGYITRITNTFSDKIHQLLDQSYREQVRTIINDCFTDDAAIMSLHDLVGGRRITGKHTGCHHLENVIKTLEYNKWYSGKALIEHFRYQRRNFTGVMIKDYWSDRLNWNDFELHFIKLYLSILNAVGMVDVYVEPADDLQYEAADFYLDLSPHNWYLNEKIVYFRLNRFGAEMLGLVEAPVEEESERVLPIIVQPNLEIIVPEGKNRINHQMLLDVFLTKVSQDLAATIYKLDFSAAVRCLERNVQLHELKDLLFRLSLKAVPENIAIMFEDWQKLVGQIRIRQVTIVETTNKYLKNELLAIKGVAKHVTNELPYAFAIDPKAITKIKREIEKKQKLVVIGDPQ